MKKLPLSYVELSKENLIHNFKALKSVAKKGTKFSVAIKGKFWVIIPPNILRVDICSKPNRA